MSSNYASGKAFCIALVVASQFVSTARSEFCDRLLVTGNPEYPPFLWRDQEDPNRLIGAAVDLLKEVVSPRKITVDAQYVGPWSRAQVEARIGNIDMLAGAFITEERQTYMDYVKPEMMAMSNVIFVRKGQSFPLQDWSDLEGKLGDTLINNSFGQAFDSFAEKNLKIEEVRSIDSAFDRLILGKTDYVIYEEFQGYAIGETRGFAEKIEHLDNPISSEGLYFTVSRKSKCNSEAFRKFLDERMQQLVREGRPEKLTEEAMELWREKSRRSSVTLAEPHSVEGISS